MAENNQATSTVTPIQPKVTPKTFIEYGQTMEVLKKWSERIVAECHKDEERTLRTIVFNALTGRIQDVNHLERSGLGYTEHAHSQLYQRAGALNAPKGALHNSAWYLSHDNRSRVWAETVDRGHKAKNVTLRMAKDVNGSGQWYARGVVSDRHSAAQGDDARLIVALINAFQFGAVTGFKDGKAGVIRDPADSTNAWFESTANFAANTGLQIGLQNSEVGLSSLRTAWTLAFRVKLSAESDEPVRIELPVRRASSYTRHVGSTVSREINFLSKSASRVMSYTPIALDLLQETSPTEAQAERFMTRMMQAHVDADTERTMEQAREFVTARLAIIGETFMRSNLAWVIALASFNLTKLAQDLIVEAAGECMP